jgi:hypothetical protein
MQKKKNIGVSGEPQLVALGLTQSFPGSTHRGKLSHLGDWAGGGAQAHWRNWLQHCLALSGCSKKKRNKSKNGTARDPRGGLKSEKALGAGRESWWGWAQGGVGGISIRTSHGKK